MDGRVGGYDIVEKIAEGGMGSVYLARLPHGGNRFVALKVLHDRLAGDATFVDMFADEARLLARLDHPSSVRLYEVGEDDEGRHFLAMELLIGESLRDIARGLAARGLMMDIGAVTWIGARVAEGLHYAHDLKNERGEPENVVHRDVNPANIFITADGRVKIIDFGLAKTNFATSQTAHGVVKGKVAYLAPEQLEGRPADRRSDIFSLGATLWELTTGRRLFRYEDDAETLRAIQRCEVPDPRTLREGCPKKLSKILLRALSKDPDDRPKSAGALGAELDAVAEREGWSAARLAAMMVKGTHKSDPPPPPDSA